MAEIHGRMPAILPADIYDLAWAGADLRDPLNPFPAEPMTMWPVSTRVNTPQNDDERLIRPIRRDGARAVGGFGMPHQSTATVKVEPPVLSGFRSSGAIAYAREVGFYPR